MILEESEEPLPKNDADELLDGMRRVLDRSGRRKFTDAEKQKILAVLRVLLS